MANPSAPSPLSPPMSTSTKIGRGLAKVLAIDLDEDASYEAQVTRGESVYSISSTAEIYVEPEPTILDWVKEFWPSGNGALQFFIGLFPFTTWIHRYNLKWAYGDIIAGVTVGCVVIPQGMAYSQLAQLPPEYGLYSSFVGVLLYWFFATSKDITIGPVAVMSVLVGNIVGDLPIEERPAVASALSLVAGGIVFGLGLFRLGFIVDYIPLTAIAAFMTGSAISIAVGQAPAMMGIKGYFSTRDSTYLVFINFLKNLGNSKIDAVMGLSALFLLYLLRWIFTNALVKRFPRWQRTWFFISTLRTAFVILLFTMISWLVNRNRRDNPLFGILEDVPKGLQHMGVPKVNGKIVGHFTKDLPASVIVLLIEHIAISKSFGRINNYTINPSQELIAIGITNIFGPFFGAYPATGSFSRTAIKSKSGVRTPFAGVVTAVLVLIALYCLTAVFFYIPDASLSAVIIHAVLDLITKPNTVYKFWRVSPIEAIIFFVGVIVTVFSSIENGIYVSVAISGALLLFRIAKARGHFLGKVKVHSVVGDHLLSDTRNASYATLSTGLESATSASTQTVGSKGYGTISPRVAAPESTRNVFLPLDHRDGSNPSIEMVSPYPGVFVYRFSEGFLYANAAHYTEHLISYIFENTRPSVPPHFDDVGDRPWNDAGPRKDKHIGEGDNRPTLKAIVLDFSSVNNVDITSVQNLLDVRNQLDRYAAPDIVEWHFASVRNRWTKRALGSAGFGLPRSCEAGREGWKPVFSVAEVYGEEVKSERDEQVSSADREKDPEATAALTGKRKKVVPVNSIGRPYFHVDLEGAVESAVVNAQRSA